MEPNSARKLQSGVATPFLNVFDDEKEGVEQGDDYASTTCLYYAVGLHYINNVV